MVHTGPSRGCQTCRNRKIKCDETRPTCQRCAASKRVCLGYKDTKNFFFRNDTEAVERKAQASRVRAAKQASRDSNSKAVVVRRNDEGSSSSDCSSPESNGDWISSPLPQDPEENSLCYFMTNYVMRRRHPEACKGFIELLIPIYTMASSRSALSLATTATALYSTRYPYRTPSANAVQARAIANYVDALRLINVAIQDPEEAKSDSLLMAVLLLGLYELIDANETPARFLGQHTHGAVALVKFRGQEMFKSDMSLKLFLAVQTQLVQHCILFCTPEPLADFMACFRGISVQNEKLNCANRLVLLTIDIPSLRLRERELLDCPRFRPDPELVAGLMRDAKAIDDNLTRWRDTVPESWHYVSIPTRTETQADLYPKSIDIYDDNAIASNWNAWRAYRLYVLAIIEKCALVLSKFHGDPNFEWEDFASINTIRELVNDICSTIPFHLGYTINDEHRTKSIYPHAFGSVQEPSSPGAWGVFMIKWPLSVALAMSYLPESQRRWMREYQAL